MTDTIGVTVTGDREVGLRFEEFPQLAKQRLKDAIADEIAKLAGRVRGAAPERTGRLRDEISSRVLEKPDAVIGVVYIAGDKGSQDYGKAAALEYGAHGTAKVKAHEAALDHIWSRPAQLRVQVAAHSRKLDLDARRFMRDPLAQMQAAIETALESAVDAAVENGE